MFEITHPFYDKEDNEEPIPWNRIHHQYKNDIFIEYLVDTKCKQCNHCHRYLFTDMISYLDGKIIFEELINKNTVF